jgi:pimeloyl-ACP methyl ester carboxylesterase
VPSRAGSSSPEREAFIAALNGVWGDHLANTGNPLAITMSLRSGGQPYQATLRAPTRRLLVLVHGLAMNDLQWTRRNHDHGQALARDLGFTPVHLHYNSGRHVSQNGREFATLLDQLVASWPLPVDELVIVGHSMGGLVARSACAFGARQHWMSALSKLVFLGTPHHGAPLERGGRLVDSLLGISPYVAPFARLGRARSAGITDLRFGNLHDADWQHRDRHAQKHDDRMPTPLPEGVAVYVVAATTADRAGSLRSSVLGDGLVPLASALGKHRDPRHALHLPERQRLVVTSASHWDLLSRADVYEALRDWLA